MKKGKILLLKRSEKVSTYRGYWGGVAGYIEENEKPEETAYKEIREEVGIRKEDLILIRKLKPVSIVDEYENKKYNWRIHPFLFKIKEEAKIKIDWEHVKYKWIKPENIVKYNTVPCLKKIVLEFFAN
jgi:8-oxo-dGTP pyrophosphatase MutT (NUDIX family)